MPCRGGTGAAWVGHPSPDPDPPGVGARRAVRWEGVTLGPVKAQLHMEGRLLSTTVRILLIVTGTESESKMRTARECWRNSGRRRLGEGCRGGKLEMEEARKAGDSWWTQAATGDRERRRDVRRTPEASGPVGIGNGLGEGSVASITASSSSCAWAPSSLSLLQLPRPESCAHIVQRKGRAALRPSRFEPWSDSAGAGGQ